MVKETMSDESKMGVRRLNPDEMFWDCPKSCLEFETTEDLEPLEGTIGQERALDAMRLGLGLYAPGYNMFICGFSGTRKMQTIQKLLSSLNPQCALPPDRAYVHNFRMADEPVLLTLPRGKAREFAKQMGLLVFDLRSSLSSLQQDEALTRRRQDVVRKYEAKGKEIFRPFEEKVAEDGFALIQTAGQGGVQAHLTPSWEGEPINWSDLEKKVKEGDFTQPELDQRQARHDELFLDMQQLMTQSMTLGKGLRQELETMTKNAAAAIVGDQIGFVRSEWKDEAIQDFLGQVEIAVLEDLELFMAEEVEDAARRGHVPGPGEGDAFVEYRVKVVLKASEDAECPILIEQSPTYQNIFGTVEYALIDGTPATDHTKIKTGDILAADGGYLILDAYDVLMEPGVWTTLKRTLLHQRLQLQPTGIAGSLGASLHLKPEPVEVSTKVLMVGDRYLYHQLQYLDDDFQQVFKVLVDFDEVVPLNEETVMLMARFLSHLVKEDGLSHFTREAVAVLINQAVRVAGDQKKMTAQLSLIADVMRESNFHATQRGADLVDEQDVHSAMNGIRNRHDLMEEKIQESILREILLVSTDGQLVGVVNGLSVYELGAYAFGRPCRITATVSLGRGGILNIEREVELSGASHDKGVLILGGFLRNRFAQDQPLSLEASIAFEQSYSEIDGDSASSSECYALLSSLSGLPIRQDIAVTGSINQLGELQAIGGANEKIEGFYEVCVARGLTGEQGVLIPKSNVQHLALKKEVVEAVRDGRFHVWAASTVDEGIALLTGKDAGELQEDGTYPEGTVNGLISVRLEEMAEEIKSFYGEGGEDPTADGEGNEPGD